LFGWAEGGEKKGQKRHSYLTSCWCIRYGKVKRSHWSKKTEQRRSRRGSGSTSISRKKKTGRPEGAKKIFPEIRMVGEPGKERKRARGKRKKKSEFFYRGRGASRRGRTILESEEK